MALIYSVFPFTVLPDFTIQKGLTFFSLFREAVLDTLFILLIPYTIITLVCVIKYKNQLLQELTHQYKENISPNMYIFYDEKGEMKLSVRPEMLYYIEAADNYIEIHYIANSKMQTLLVRNSLKRIETQFYNTQLIRCHRSYIVNIGNVQLLKKTKHELLIDFGVEPLPNIPVSRGYYDIITDMFSRTVQNETLPL
jgi:DNA-binding LytR/AlgR family response regulator